MSGNYSQFTDAIILNTTFRNDAYLGSSSHAAYYLILLGTVAAGLAMITFVCNSGPVLWPHSLFFFFSGAIKHTVTFLISTSMALLGSFFLLIGAAVWTVIIKKAQSINDFSVGPSSNPVPLGFTLTVGPALYMLWTAVACLLGSVIPYMIRCVKLNSIE